MILITQSLKELQQVMSDYVGIVRNNVRLGTRHETSSTYCLKKQKTYIKPHPFRRIC